MGLPLVDNHRQVKLRRQRHLRPKGRLLTRPGDVLVVVIQPDLANGEHLFVFT